MAFSAEVSAGNFACRTYAGITQSGLAALFAYAPPTPTNSARWSGFLAMIGARRARRHSFVHMWRAFLSTRVTRRTLLFPLHPSSSRAGALCLATHFPAGSAPVGAGPGTSSQLLWPLLPLGRRYSQAWEGALQRHITTLIGARGGFLS